MQTHKEQAEALRLALTAGFATVDDAVEWADRVVAAETRPEVAILEVALAGGRRPADVLTLLRAVPGEADPDAVTRATFARLLADVRRDRRRGAEVARWLARLLAGGDLSPERYGWDPYGIEDAFGSAAAGVYGTHAAAVAQLEEYLEYHIAARAP